MSKTTKILIVVGCTLSGCLNGLAIVMPESAQVFAGINAGIALIIASITGISIARSEE